MFEKLETDGARTAANDCRPVRKRSRMKLSGRHVNLVFACAHMVGVAAMGEVDSATERRTSASEQENGECNRVTPNEDEDAILRNPDMGWVLLENYPLDQRPGGSSTLATLPGDDFPDLDYVALMCAWSDIETSEGVYDFTHANYAYDYWRARGKRIHLRISTASLLWWPDRGLGAPQYVLHRLLPEQKQTRHAGRRDYVVVDARDAYYLDRLRRFLKAVRENFAEERPVELIDLRGFGLWGEWHSGYRYPSTKARQQALHSIIDSYSEAFPHHYLALSYSYDPDAPPETWSGTTAAFDPAETHHYDDFVRFSAFDYALTKPNVTFRRDGCGGTVHSNERKFVEQVFARLDKGPLTCEFFEGYRFFKEGDGWWNPDRALDDALNLHPNFIVVLGWQTSQARDFVRERPDLVVRGLRSMGYRLVPVEVSWPAHIGSNPSFTLRTQWANRGVGRAVADYALEVIIKDAAGRVVLDHDAGRLATSRWIKGETFEAAHEIPLSDLTDGECILYIGMRDPRTGRQIQLPLADEESGAYRIGGFRATRITAAGASASVPADID